MSDIALAGIAIFLIFFALVASCWIYVSSYLFTDITESFLSRSKFVASNRRALSGLGLLGKAVRNGSMALMFFFPKLCERRGLIEKDELLNLPVHLKRKLLAPWIAGGIAFFATFVFWLLVI
jgi:hypothetical protein